MHTKSARLFSLVLFFVSAFVTSRATAGPVIGRVLDPSGRAIQGAGVLLVGGSSVLERTETDATGAFRIVTPDQGRFQLRVAADGFNAEPMTFDAQATLRDVGPIAVQISAVSESLVVSAAQVEIPLSRASSSVTVLSGAELETSQIRTVADALRQVPGLTVARNGSYGALTGVFPRGGESDYTLVFVDGIQLNAFGGGFDFSHLSANAIDRIEIVRGPQSALYGSNAIGAVVRIVTRRDGSPRGEASIEGGSFGTSRLAASSSGSSNGWFWGGGAERLASHGFNGRRTARGEEISNDQYERNEAGASGGWRSETGLSIGGELRFEHDDRGFPGAFGSNPAGIFSGVDTVSRGTDDRWSGSISTNVPSGRRVRTHAMVTWNSIAGTFVARSDFSPAGRSVSESGSRRLTARAQADVTLARGLDLSTGIEFQRERVTSTYITDDAGETPVKRTVAGYFGEARWSPVERLFVTAGLRIEDVHRDPVGALHDAFSPRPSMPADRVVSVNPRAGASYYLRSTPGWQTKVRAAAGTGIRPPNGFDIAFTDNPSLKPERSRSVEAGVDQTLGAGRAHLEATWFSNTFDDLIVAVGKFVESSRYRTDNISNARARGLELATTVRGRADGVDVEARVGYTFLDSAILAVDRSPSAPPPFHAGQPLLQRPRHQWSLDVSAARGPWTAWMRGGGRGRVLAVEPTYGTFGGLFTAAGYDVWSTGASWTMTRNVRLLVRVENLFDRSYEEVFGFPAPGRAATIGVRVASRR